MFFVDIHEETARLGKRGLFTAAGLFIHSVVRGGLGDLMPDGKAILARARETLKRYRQPWVLWQTTRPLLLGLLGGPRTSRIQRLGLRVILLGISGFRCLGSIFASVHACFS